MGMDVSGKKPRSKTGEYFRNNCWYWRPLWEYCSQVAPELCKTVRYAHTNDGDGLDDQGSLELSKLLFKELDLGNTAKVEKEYQEERDSLPDEDCRICEGTGYRLEPPRIGKGESSCNVCDATGKKRPVYIWYGFTEKNVREFAEFLKDCGGFEIY